ncbi:MAG: HAMP domain-containing histidine kinase [Gemmataceae bacterium]|nr:HAMP domain-containing histidine kinase [Gemmataceae bacterium]
MKEDQERDRQQAVFMDHLVDLTSRVAHEFNNVLNSILLQLALFEQRGLTPQANPELATMRRLGNGAATMIKQFQQLLHKHQVPLETLDLNPVVQQAVTAWQQENPSTPPIASELAPDLPPVLGSVADLTRLVHLLLSSAAAAMSGTPGIITLRTQRTPQQVQLRVEDPGPGIAPELLPRLFEPFAVTRPGGAGWELTVCKAVASRLHGACHGENRGGGGMVFVVDLRVAPA